MLFGTGLAFFWGKPFIQPRAPHLASLSLGAWNDSPALRSALEINVLFTEAAMVMGLNVNGSCCCQPWQVAHLQELVVRFSVLPGQLDRGLSSGQV